MIINKKADNLCWVQLGEREFSSQWLVKGCFGLVPNTGLNIDIIHWWGSWEFLEGWEETQLGQMTLADQRDIPDHMTSCLLYKGRKKEEWGRHLEGWSLSSQVTITCDGALLFWRWLNTWLPMRSSELTPCFALPVCMVLLSLLRCLYLNPQVV